MRANKGFVIASCLLWAGILLLSLARETDIGFLVAMFLLPLILIGWVVLLLIAVSRLLLRHELPWQKRLVPLYFSCVPVAIWVVLGTASREIDKEATWLTVKIYDFRGSNNFKFKKDGSYRQWRESPLGSSTQATGRYERHDSILVLHPYSDNDTSRAVKLAIRPYAIFMKPHASSSITLAVLDTAAQPY